MTNHTTIELSCREVGSWPMNVYRLVCPLTGHCAIVNPGVEDEVILQWLPELKFDKILTTSGVPGHVSALEEVQLHPEAYDILHPADTLTHKNHYGKLLQHGPVV